MKRRLRRPQEAADLDITAFMNLMIVLVPILLINMIIAHTSVLELNFPESSNPNDDLDKAHCSYRSLSWKISWLFQTTKVA